MVYKTTFDAMELFRCAPVGADFAVTGSSKELNKFITEIEDLGFERSILESTRNENTDNVKSVIVSPYGLYGASDRNVQIQGSIYSLANDRDVILERLAEKDIKMPSVVHDRKIMQTVSTLVTLVQEYMEILSTKQELAQDPDDMTSIIRISMAKMALMRLEHNFNMLKSQELLINQNILDVIKKQAGMIQFAMLNQTNTIGETAQIADELVELRLNLQPLTDNSGNMIWAVYYVNYEAGATFCTNHRAYHFAGGLKTVEEIRKDLQDKQCRVSTVINSNDNPLSVNSPVEAVTGQKGEIKSFYIDNGLLFADVDTVVDDEEQIVGFDVTLLTGRDCADRDFLGNPIKYGDNLWCINVHGETTNMPNAGFTAQDALSFLDEEDAHNFNPIIREIKMFSKKEDAEKARHEETFVLSLADVQRVTNLSPEAYKYLSDLVTLRKALSEEHASNHNK